MRKEKVPSMMEGMYSGRRHLGGQGNPQEYK